jgi:hypothetical protein
LHPPRKTRTSHVVPPIDFVARFVVVPAPRYGRAAGLFRPRLPDLFVTFIRDWASRAFNKKNRR